jgi:hypothetical protein
MAVQLGKLRRGIRGLNAVTTLTVQKDVRANTLPHIAISILSRYVYV